MIPYPAESSADEVAQRKADHLRITASEDVEARSGAGWADIHLVHEALPTLDLDEVDLGTTFLGRRLKAPLMIAAMTGGHDLAEDVNRVLARAAEKYGLAMGLGSQRAGLRNPDLASTYGVAREEAPTAMLIGNIGVAQLVSQRADGRLSFDQARQAISMLRADALAIHLNFLQESVQPEGDRRARGTEAGITAVVRDVGVPVIAKETGAGLSRSTAVRLRRLGVAGLDVGGVGGTSFAAVEGLRAAARGDLQGQQLGELLRDWGVPTAVSVVAALPTGLPIIATGGVRTGLDAAKALTLGAGLVGVARPLLQAALEGQEAVDRWIERFLAELRTVLFLTGSRQPAELRERPRVILGTTRAWLDQLNY